MYRSLIENSKDAILVVSGSKVVYVNTVTVKLCGYDKPEDIIGKDALGFISLRYREQFRERIRSRLGGEPQPERFDHEIVRRDGSIVQVETTASLINYGGKSAVLFVARDITERKRFVSKLVALHQYAAQLGVAESLVEVSETTMSAITSVMGFKLANFMVRGGDQLDCVNEVGFETIYWNVPIKGERSISRAARERRTVVANDLSGDSDLNGQQGVQSELATPVVVQGEVEAVIGVESTVKGAFTDFDVQILEIIAQHVASALERIGHS
jgi:PAS domain S-box-containing protein